MWTHGKPDSMRIQSGFEATCGQAYFENYVASYSNSYMPEPDDPLFVHHTERSLVCLVVFATSVAKPAAETTIEKVSVGY